MLKRGIARPRPHLGGGDGRDEPEGNRQAWDGVLLHANSGTPKLWMASSCDMAYSYRSARIGSIRLAFRAGINPAVADTTDRTTTVATAIVGS